MGLQSNMTSKAQKVLQSSMTSCEETTQPEVAGVHDAGGGTTMSHAGPLTPDQCSF